jgi:hypothetical protein
MALPGPSCTRANGTLMARGLLRGFYGPNARCGADLGFHRGAGEGNRTPLSAREVNGVVHR